MTDQNKYMEFHKLFPDESHKSVIERLRKNLSKQLGLIKWLFFRNEYMEIKKIMLQPDDKFIPYLMKKEQALYLKSIVVCTTGPIAIAKSLFGGYAFNSDYFAQKIQPYSFNNYGLQHSFQSKNSIRMHDNLLRMMMFLGAEEGKLNDSSWLEKGAQLQISREEQLLQRKQKLTAELPHAFSQLKADIEEHVSNIKNDLNHVLGFYRRKSRMAKIAVLEEILLCFKEKSCREFDVLAFRTILTRIKDNKNIMYAALYSSRVQELVKGLDMLCHEAVIFSLTNNNKIGLGKRTVKPVGCSVAETPIAKPDTSHSASRSFFSAQGTNGSPPASPLSNSLLK